MNSLSYQSVLFTQPWALSEDYLPLMIDLFERRVINGERMSRKELKALGWTVDPVSYYPIDSEPEARDGYIVDLGGPAAAGTSASATPTQGSKIAVLNVQGPIAQKPAGMSGPGVASTETIGANFDAAMADPTVKAIVFNIDSPGGGVYGVQELAEKIMASRGQGKPIVAQVNSMAASAAYWIAAAADEIVITPSGQAGSIGVYVLHTDQSGALAKAGVNPTFVKAGKYKVEGNQLGPLSDEAQAAMQQNVDGYYNAFAKGVADGRGTTTAEVKSGYGEGRALRAPDAVKAKLADRVGTMASTLKRLGSTRGAAIVQASEMKGDAQAFDNAALAFLPDATPAEAADVKPITFTKTTAEDGTFAITAHGTPERILVSTALLMDDVNGTEYLRVGAGKLMIQVANGEAVYRVIGKSNGTDLLCVLQSSTIPAQKTEDETAIDAPAASETGENWRRRRAARRQFR